MTDAIRAALEELRRAGLLEGAPGAEELVPELVLRSWRRSIGNSVGTDPVPPRFQQIDGDSLLQRAAGPVLDRWQDRLSDTGTTLFLSDRGGSIVARRTSDSSVRRRLDRVHAAEGFDYSEESVGTNGLGTSMVEARAVFIQGSQHYNDALAELACAAAPVRSPGGVVLGSISLGGPLEVASPLMLSLTQEIGQQIEERLRSDSRPQDLAMAMSFMRFTNSQRPTLIVDGESLLANTPGLPYVSVHSHVELWELLSAQDWSGGGPVRLRLDGIDADVVARLVADGHRPHYVVHFGEADAGARSSSSPIRPFTAPKAPAGVLVVDGPAGSGRAEVARGLLHGGPPAEVDLGHPVAWSEVDDLLAGGSSVLLRRAEKVSSDEMDELVRRLRRPPVGAGRLIVTVDATRVPAALAAAIGSVGVAARTMPLARTPERIPGLVRRVLDDLDPDRRHTLSPAALQALGQWNWPGNLSELVATLTTLIEGARVSVIERRHLPSHLRQAPPRRHLTLVEAAERDAIIRALDASAGNKSEAAELLGIGRTTLYRWMRRLGLEGGEGSL